MVVAQASTSWFAVRPVIVPDGRPFVEQSTVAVEDAAIVLLYATTWQEPNTIAEIAVLPLPNVAEPVTKSVVPKSWPATGEVVLALIPSGYRDPVDPDVGATPRLTGRKQARTAIIVTTVSHIVRFLLLIANVISD